MYQDLTENRRQVKFFSFYGTTTHKQATHLTVNNNLTTDIRNIHLRMRCRPLCLIKVEILRRDRGKESGREGKRMEGRCGPPDETQKRIHFYFASIFCEVVVLIRFKTAHSTAARATMWLLKSICTFMFRPMSKMAGCPPFSS